MGADSWVSYGQPLPPCATGLSCFQGTSEEKLFLGPPSVSPSCSQCLEHSDDCWRRGWI